MHPSTEQFLREASGNGEVRRWGRVAGVAMAAPAVDLMTPAMAAAAELRYTGAGRLLSHGARSRPADLAGRPGAEPARTAGRFLGTSPMTQGRFRLEWVPGPRLAGQVWPD